MQMRNRIVAAAVAGLALLGAVTACGSGKSTKTAPSYAATQASFAAGSTMERLHNAGKITVGVKFDQPGVGMKNPATDKPEGFDIEIAKIVAAGLGLKPEQVDFKEAVSKNREPFLQNGTVDMVIASYSITDARKQVVGFAGPYYVTGQQLMVRKDDSSINGPDDLAGKKVCSVTGSTPLATIQTKYKSAVAVPFATYTECVQQLINKSVDAVTTDGVILLGYAAKQPSQLKVVGQPFSTEKYGIGLKKDDAAFRAFVDDTLQKAMDSGDWKKAYDATLGASGTPAPQPPALEKY
jgi:glutamate transport system substrate-binding protein